METTELEQLRAENAQLKSALSAIRTISRIRNLTQNNDGMIQNVFEMLDSGDTDGLNQVNNAYIAVYNQQMDSQKK